MVRGNYAYMVEGVGLSFEPPAKVERFKSVPITGRWGRTDPSKHLYGGFNQEGHDLFFLVWTEEDRVCVQIGGPLDWSEEGYLVGGGRDLDTPEWLSVVSTVKYKLEPWRVLHLLGEFYYLSTKKDFFVRKDRNHTLLVHDSSSGDLLFTVSQEWDGSWVLPDWLIDQSQLEYHGLYFYTNRYYRFEKGVFRDTYKVGRYQCFEDWFEKNWS